MSTSEMLDLYCRERDILGLETQKIVDSLNKKENVDKNDPMFSFGVINGLWDENGKIIYLDTED